MAKIYCYHGSIVDAGMGVETLLSKSPELTPPPSRKALGSENGGRGSPLIDNSFEEGFPFDPQP